MKTYPWMILAAALSCNLLAQQAAPKTARPASEREAAVPLRPGPAGVKQNNVNVRGQPSINSEVVARLKKGDRVTVLEEITLPRPKLDEPARWAKIALPANVTVWVHSMFIDPASHAVVPKRLNMRSGPGENYSVLGRLDKGAVVKEVETKGEWIKIDPGTNSYAFVASHLLTPEAAPPPAIAAVPAPVVPAPAPAPPPAVTTPVPTPPPAEATTPPPPTPTPVAVAPAVAVVPAPAPAPAPAETTPPPAPAETKPGAAVTPLPAAAEAKPAAALAPLPVVTPQPQPQVVEEPRRIVTREGIVRRSVSIQAPTYYVLQSLDTGKPINYLFSTNIVLRDFKGRRIVVTGEELLDERWPNTPVIAIEKTNNIDVVQ